MDNFFARLISGVLYAERHREFFPVGSPRLLHFEIVVLKAGVTKSVSKGEQHILLDGIVIPVANVNALAVLNCCRPTGVIVMRWGIFHPKGECFRQFSAGIDSAKQDVGYCSSPGLTTQVTFQNDRHIVRPGHLYRRAIAQRHNDLFICGGYSFDKCIMPRGHFHVVTIQPFGFVKIGQPRTNDHHICRSGNLDRLLD